MLTVGRAAARRSEGSRLRFVALLCATVALALGALSFVAGLATYDGRDERGAARAPRFVGENAKAGKEATALWRESFDTAGGLQHDVILIEPLVDGAPLPPGVKTWPSPGEAVLSPALRTALADEDALNRYGRVVGDIAESGLEVPGERLAYVRPAPGTSNPESMLKIAGYGTETRASMGDQVRVQTLSAYIPTVVGLLMLPSAALTVIAARSGAAGRDRRTALLRALGAGTRARALVNIGEAIVPVTIGATAVAALTGWAMTANLQVPFVEFTLSATDVRRWAPALFAAILAAAVTVICTVTALHRVNKASNSTRPKGSVRNSARWALWACPVLLLVAVRGSELVGGVESNPTIFFAVYTLGVIGTLATLPAVIAAAVAGIGRLLVRYGNRRGSPSAVIAGRWNISHPGVTTRMVASIVIAIGLVTQIQLWSSRLTGPMMEARATFSRIGESALTVSSLSRTTQAPVDAFLRSLPSSVHALGMYTDADSNISLQGDCAALKALNAPCQTRSQRPTEPRLQEFATWNGTGDGKVTLREGQVATDRQAPESIFLVSDRPGNLPVSVVKKAAFQHFLGPQVDSLGSSWLVGARQLEKTSLWVLLLGLAGVVLLALAAALNNLGDFLRFSRTLAPLSVLTSRRTVFFGTALWAVLLPMATAGLVGTAAAVWLGTPMTRPGGGATLSWPVLSATLVVVEAMAIACWWWGAATASSGATRWRPKAD
ncbi:hypothetical protein SAMN05216268_106289 [Streptomyces yunnanensis]|uniref:ABC3 transporter permease C-terminal domain-containing protein n=1 Tax=Streptomyces yunnanensis TaxID=156453 RepID=A0A9X8MU19_9ACTN|nr:hypothetical protein SAMN05216268_106289 [Streptomyces yunnanensis]